MNILKSYVFSALIISPCLLKAQGEISTITTAVPFLMIAPDARSSGLGDAGAATTADANSIYWNASKLAFIKKEMGVSLSYTPWMRALVPDMNLAYVSAYKKLGKQTLALSVKYFSMGYTIFTNSTGAFVAMASNPNEYAVDFAYARKLSDHLSGGLAFRYIYSDLTNGFKVGGASTKAGQSLAADVSGYYQNKFSENLSYAFGGNISNIGSKISYTDSSNGDFIPTNLKLGTSVKEYINSNHSFEIAFDVNKLLVPTQPNYDSLGGIAVGYNPNTTVVKGMIQSFYDAPGGATEELHELNYSVGIEYKAFNTLALRTGYFYEHPTKGARQFITLGTGISYKALTFDFSYWLPTTERSPLENTVKFSLALNMDKLFLKKEKSI